MTDKQDGDCSEKNIPQNLDLLLNEVAQKITGNSLDTPSRFSFSWQEIHFIGQILSAEDHNNFTINLIASFGYIPFSAEDKSRRKKLLTFFAPLFISGDVTLSTNSQIQMTVLTDFAGPMNIKRLVEVITFTLLDLQQDLKSYRASTLT